jgi:hypothetical protein
MRPTSHVFLASILVIAAGCGPSFPTLELTKGAMRSLPVVNAAGTVTKAALASRRVATVQGMTIADYGDLALLFKLECQSLPYANYCPPTVTPTTAIDDPTRFEMGSLIGMVFHAQMYAGEHVTACSGDGYSGITVGRDSYVAGNATSSLANPTRFVLDEYARYTCRSRDLSDDATQTRVVSATDAYQATLHTRYRYDADTVLDQTDLFQIDVSLDGGTPTLLAFNFAAATPHASRIVLLTNLLDHRFALKYYTPVQGGGSARWVTAIGIGGFDLTTGVANVGHYVASLGQPGLRLCVDNVGGIIESDISPCLAAAVPAAWVTRAAVEDFLGLDATTINRISTYLDYFEDDSPLAGTDAWAAPGDEDLYWPAGLVP